jgi:hypothetical protein
MGVYSLIEPSQRPIRDVPFREGKIIELTEFADTALIKDLMSGATESRGTT